MTGAASGIGRATAMLLATRGADVALLDKDAKQGAIVADEIVQETPMIQRIIKDAPNPEGVRQTLKGFYSWQIRRTTRSSSGDCFPSLR